jgi:HTH-type transcriptional regulator / antitoxin HigA
MSKALVPARVPPPGRRLKDEIEKRLWTQEDVAKIIGRPSQVLSEIISGKKQITPTTALELGDAFGTSPEFWSKLESDYQLSLARKDHGANDITRRSFLFDLLPIRELIKRKWLGIKDLQDLDQLERQICAFAGVHSVDEMPKLAANFKGSSSTTRTPEVRGQNAWLLRVRNLASRQEVGTFSFEKLDEVIQQLLVLSKTPNDVAKIPKLLKQAGIRFVVVPHLSKTYLDGAAFHLGDSPVVAVTMRYDRIDNFWFVLMHELCHIRCKHPDVYFDEVIRKGDRPSKGAIEQEADDCARTFLINPEIYQEFVEETFMDLDEEKIHIFAKNINRHPGIVVGRLHWDEALHFSEGRHLLEKVSPYLAEIVDKP